MSGGAPPPSPPHHHHFPDLRSIFSSNTALLAAAVVFLVLVLLFVLLLHLYAKCFLLPRIPPPLHSFPAPSGRHPPGISGDSPPPAKGGGLDSSAIAAIPLFEYGSGTGAAAAPSECVICLAAFRDGDKGRTLPACAHRSFHVDCIDTWLLSRSTCPVCRAPVIANPPAPETDEEDESPPPASGEPTDSVAIEINDDGNDARNHDPESAETPPSVASLQQLGCSLRRMMGRNNRSERKIHPSTSSSNVNQIQLGDS